MDDGKNDDIKPIFIGNRPDILAYTVGDLITVYHIGLQCKLQW